MVPSDRQRYNTQLLPLSLLAGVLIVALGTVSLVAIYLNRVSASVGAMARSAPVESYEGRPEKTAPSPGSMAPLDYLVLVADADHNLVSVHLVNLAGSRQELTLVSLPSDLLVSSGPRRAHRTLADLYQDSGVQDVTREVEQLLGVRTDHQAQVAVDGFTMVVEAMGGLEEVADAPAEADPTAYITAAPDSPGRAERVSGVFRSTLERLGMTHAMINPPRFDAVLRALEHCTQIDSQLTSDELEATVMETSVRAEDIGEYLLPTVPVKDGRTAVPRGLVALRKALAADSLSTLTR